MKLKHILTSCFFLLLFCSIAVQISIPKFNSVITEESESETESSKQIESEFILITFSTFENVKEEIILKSKNNYKKYLSKYENILIKTIQSPPPEII